MNGAQKCPLMNEVVLPGKNQVTWFRVPES
jgi:hypothetical protein